MQQTTHQAPEPVSLAGSEALAEPEALLAGLDSLLAVLEAEPAGDCRFRFAPDDGRAPARVYGGQLLAQAIVAAAATAPGKVPLSLHAAFVRPGTPGLAIEAEVTPVRDGRTIATRQVTLLENGKTILTAIVSLHADRGDPDGGEETLAELAADAGTAADPLSSPDETPSIQDWARRLPDGLAKYGRHWIERPPAVELRMTEPPCFLGQTRPGRTRSHWMRAPRDLGADPVLNAAVLAYASDFLLMDMVFHAHPVTSGPGNCNGVSLDHALWFHRPVTFGQWHRHAQEAVTLTGQRGLARGTITGADGRLAATVTQEVLVLPAAAR
jgi:acyl-CoA thioesterase-2